MKDEKTPGTDNKNLLTCRDVNDFLALYLDDRLDDELKERFERHMARCSSCLCYFEQYRDTTLLVREAGELPEPPPDELVDTTLAFLRDHIAARGDRKDT